MKFLLFENYLVVLLSGHNTIHVLLPTKSRTIFGVSLPEIAADSSAWAALQAPEAREAVAARLAAAQFQGAWACRAVALILHAYTTAATAAPPEPLTRWRESLKGLSAAEAYLVVAWFAKAGPQALALLNKDVYPRCGYGEIVSFIIIQQPGS